MVNVVCLSTVLYYTFPRIQQKSKLYTQYLCYNYYLPLKLYLFLEFRLIILGILGAVFQITNGVHFIL